VKKNQKALLQDWQIKQEVTNLWNPSITVYDTHRQETDVVQKRLKSLEPNQIARPFHHEAPCVASIRPIGPSTNQ
jgi:hypothetical protein